MSLQQSASDLTVILGQSLMVGGGAGLLVMAAIGTIAIDLVFLTYAEKQRNAFLTGFLFGSLFNGPSADPSTMLIASPITSAIAVVLSIALGVPQVGAAIMAGWLIAATMFTIGYGVYSLGKELEPASTYRPSF